MSVEIDPATETARAERPLRSSGNSVVLTIPPQILQQADLCCGDVVELEAKLGDGEIILTEQDNSDE